jgi:tetratricopeptide (TPR) repeat protein
VLLDRLGNRLKLLTGGARNLPERQRTLRNAIEWSYDLLDEGEKLLFGRLGVFSSGSTLEAMEAVCDAEGDLPTDVFEGASSLLDKSLLRQEEGAEGEPRFVMLETIHEFANVKLEESGEAEELRRLHAEYFLALSEEAEPGLKGPKQEMWLERLEPEHNNMRAALSWVIGRGESELGLRLADALWRFWWMGGYFDEGRRWLEEILAQNDGAQAPRGKALEGLSWLSRLQGDLDRAEALAEEGLELSAEAGVETSTVASLRGTLGDVVRSRGEHERAKELFEESVRLYREIGDRWGVAWSLGSLANVAGDRGDHEQAKRLYEEGLALSRRLGDASALGVYLVSLGYEYLLEGNLEKAAELNEEAAALFRKHGRRGDLQYALVNLGWAALLQGDHERAAASYQECLVLCRELDDRLTASESLEGLACSVAARGEATRASVLFGAAETLREATGYQLAPRDRSLREPYLVAVHAQLGEAAWSAAWEEGRSMEFEDAVVYALEKPHS